MTSLRSLNPLEMAAELHQFRAKKILVLGDLILDVYEFGQVTRISPEAPIPILKVEKTENRLGGAGCVAADLVALGATVNLVGFVGKDPHAQLLKALLREASIGSSGLKELENFQTIVKRRFLAEKQQLLRVDYEKNFQFTPKEGEAWLEEWAPLLEGYDAWVLSDYAKGFFPAWFAQKIIQIGRALGAHVIVDPQKSTDYSRYKSCTTMKPNRLELAFATGMAVGSIAEALKAAEALQQTVQAEFLSISLDKGGMLYFKNAQDFHLFPAEVKEVFDVSGAGDVVTALLAMTMAHQMPINSIFSLANLAACIEISKLGATSVSLAEMLNELTPMHLRKVIAKDALAELRNRSEEDWILTFGYFDDLKPGHLKFIQAMASLNGVRVVAINSDRSIEKNKGQKPLLSEEERASLLASFSHIDWVVIFDEPNASYLVEVLRPNILVKGEAHKGKPLPEQKAVEAVGAKLVYLPRF